MPRLEGLCLLAVLLLATAAGAEKPEERLAEAIRFQTISHQDPAALDASAFRALQSFLVKRFPKLHAVLSRERIAGYSLLYTWPGRDPDLAPILLSAHQDVVPVAPGTEAAWSHPAFAGVIADGYVWGRGALDDKVGVLGMLEAVEGLVAEGFQPRRTVYLAFGHDEEIGGDAGAEAITKRLEAQGVHLWFSLDEGMAIGEHAVPGLASPVALIGVAEKGYLTLRLTTHAAGGHSSTPAPGGAILRLSRALVRVADPPQPARIGGVVADLLQALAPHMGFPTSFVMAHPWLFAPLLRARLEETPASAAMLRTTTALTIVEAGVKENVLPQSATALVNFRLIPGDRSAAVIARVKDRIGDPEVEIDVVQANEPSPQSDSHSDSFALLARTVAQVAPDAIVAPALVLGGTDSKHYGRLARNSYRFMPFRMTPSDFSRVHGVDERIAVRDYRAVIRFYRELLLGTSPSA